MLLSMTGYGRATSTFGDRTITVEIRSLNSKFTDVRFKIPALYREKEIELRKLILSKTFKGDKIHQVEDIIITAGCLEAVAICLNILLT